MKRPLSLLSTLALISLLAIPAMSFAGNGDEVEKKKTISKSYPVSVSDKLNIENSFGEVVITTWAKNEIKVDIEMTASAGSEERAQKILDEIGVTDKREGSNIYLKTNVGSIHDSHGNSWSKSKKDGNNRAFEINYTVTMPSSNPLHIENSFGKITVPDFSGPVSLISKFGSLKAGNLTNVEEVDVEFGSAEIDGIHNGKSSFKYDSKSSINRISGAVKIGCEFSDRVQFQVDNAIDELSINESYSTISVIVQKELSANFNIHTSFGDFSNHTGFSIPEDKDDDDNAGPRFDKDYHGKSGDGRSKIKIKSSFGEVRLSHQAEKDSDDDREDRMERKEKREKKERKEKKEKTEQDNEQQVSR